MKVLKCTDLANEIKLFASSAVSLNNVKPKVVILKANNDKASATYVKRKMETMCECGIDSELIEFEPWIETDYVVEEIARLNDDKDVTGIIVQMPLYPFLDSFEILEAISPMKDIDCLTSKNIGLMMKGEPRVLPATPVGVISFLETITEIDGKNVLILGRSEIVGLPLSVMLTQENATVTLAHSHSEYDVNAYDIVISAIGVGESVLVTNPNTICIDVGISYKEVDGKRVQIGDFDINNPLFNCKLVTAPKGGTGILTSSTVCLSAVKLAVMQQQ